MWLGRAGDGVCLLCRCVCVRGSWHDGPLGCRHGNSLAVTPAALRSLGCSYMGHRRLLHSHRYGLKVGFCSFSSFFFLFLLPSRLSLLEEGGKKGAAARLAAPGHCSSLRMSGSSSPSAFPEFILSAHDSNPDRPDKAQICKIYLA